jgi:RimJ/RimL family protein N-acetyltransferase
MVQDDLARSRAVGGCYCAIRDEEGNLVGVVDYTSRRDTEGLAFIELLMIGAPWRRRGIGRTVVAALERYLAASFGIRTVESAVQVNNPGGLAFWRNLGYQRDAAAVRQEDGTVTYRLRKALTRSTAGDNGGHDASATG